MPPKAEAIDIEDATAQSPCTGVCRLDDDAVCVGCGRSLAEIAAWARMTDRERWAVVDRLRAGRDATTR